MRPLSDEELKVFFEKLSKYIGRNIKLLIERNDNEYCFRLLKDRVYYVSEKIMKQSTNFSRKQLMSIGTSFGKFTHSGKFKLHITALDYIAPYAKYKIWIKPNGEQSFLYGNHVIKAHLGRITESTPTNAGVIIFSMADVPIGFGATAKSTQECRKLDPTAIVAYNQADVGEYLRDEETLT